MKTLRRIFLLLLLLTPFIELANASFVRNNVFLGNIGQIYKGAIIVLALILLDKKQRSFYLMALGLGGAFSILHYLLSPVHSLTNFVNDILFVVKVTYIVPLTFIAADVSKRFILITSLVAWLTIVANIFLGILGQGYTQYALAYGYKGFFFSGNEMALTLMVTSAILLYLLYEQRKFTLGVFFSLFLLLLGPLQGMKTLLIGLPLIAITVPLILYKDTIFEQVKRMSQAKQTGILLGVIGFIVTAVTLLYVISPQFFVRFSEITQRSGIIGAVLSERDKYLKAGWTEYIHTYSPTQRLFGVGNLAAQQSLIVHFKNPKTIEIDFFDLLFSFGILALVYYAIWVRFISVQAKSQEAGARFALFINILLFVLSLITGHVVYSTFLATYWAICNGFAKKKQLPAQLVFIGPMSRGGIRTYMMDTARNFAKKEIAIPIYNTHSPIDFFVTTFKLLLLTLEAMMQRQKLFFHYHLATGGSFVRKFLLALLFYPITDTQILHIHGGKAPLFFDQLLKLPGGKPLLRLFFSLFSKVIVVSSGLAIDIEQVLDKHWLSYNKNLWIALPNAIELPPKLPKPMAYKKGDKLHILFLGRLVTAKNLPFLMEIITAAHNKKLPVHFTLVGDGPDRPLVEKQIALSKLGNTVKLVGWVQHEKVDELYQKHHLFIIPSLYESFGLVVLEAYKNGLPALGTNIGGLRDVIEDGKTGYLHKLYDTAAFVESLENLIKSPTTLTVLQRNAQIKVREFDYDDHIDKLTQLVFDTEKQG